MAKKKSPDPIGSSLMTLDELRAVAPEGTDVVAFLDALGIPHGGGLVSRVHVERALGLRGAHSAEQQDAAPITVLRKVLRPAAIDVQSATRRRGWKIVLAAREHRRVYNELHEEDSERWPAVELLPGSPLEAKLYLASKRHLSAAHFLVSGLDAAPDDALFIFVLVPEERVWLATKRELRMLHDVHDDDEGGAKVKMKKKYGRVGASQGNARRRALKVWFPVGNTSFDIEEQIHDAHGKLVLNIVQRGGRPR